MIPLVKSTSYWSTPLLFWFPTFLVILPFLLLSFYKHPLGTHEWDWISAWNGTMEQLSFLEQQKYWYNELGGRYTSHAMLSITSIWYTLTRFQFFFAFNLLLLYGSITYLLKSIFRQKKIINVYLLSAILFATYLDSLSNVYESIYRLTVVQIYQFGLMGNMLIAATLIRLYFTEKHSFLTPLFLGILVLFTSGCNELSLALLYINFVIFGSIHYWNKKNIPIWFWLILILLLSATFLSFNAPGNQVRQEAIGVNINLGKAFFLTIGASGYIWLSWLSNSLLLPLAILITPFIVKYKDELSKIDLFQKPWWWLLITLLIVPSILLPFFWKTGGQAFPERVIDFLFMVILFSCISTLITFVVNSKLKIPFTFNFPMKILLGLVFVWANLHLFIGHIDFNRVDKQTPISFTERITISANAGRAWRSLINGDANNYSQEVQAQYAQLKNCDRDICEITPPSIFPFPLYDNLYDRRDKGGDPFMGWAINGQKQIVTYKK